MANGFTYAFARIVRSLQRKKRRVSSATGMHLLTSECFVPQTSTLPSAFFRQVRAIADQVSAMATHQLHAPTMTKLFDRVALMLADKASFQDQAEGKKRLGSSGSMRSVSLEVATENLLQLWESVLHYVDVFNNSEDVYVSLEELDQFEHSAIHLLKLVVQRPEFDVFLMSMAKGGCSVHRGEQRKRSIGSKSALEREESFMAPRASMISVKKSGHRSSFFKREKEKNGTIPSCLLARKFLELHQNTIQYVRDLETDPSSTLMAPRKEDFQMLQSALLASSYVRIPFLRENMLVQFQNLAAGSNRGRAKPRSGSLYEEMNLALFTWDHGLHPKCRACVAPFDREEFWMEEEQMVEDILDNREARLMFCAQLMEHLSTNTWGRIEWKCIPGFVTLYDLMLTLVREVFKSQAQALEPMLGDDDGMERASSSNRGLRDSFSKRDSPATTFFFHQIMKLVSEEPKQIHDLLMSILECTNYTQPHHVTLCLSYLEKFMVEFPAFFRSKSSTDSPTTETLTFVFKCLLESEHFEVLKSTQLFLLKSFPNFSCDVRAALVDVMGEQFSRLFLHWHRDVRFCYFHMLIYLTYPGNRISLCAKSDELIMGAEAAYLFEIPGLVRSPSAADWDVFDLPLCQLLTEYNCVSKGRRSMVSKQAQWIENIAYPYIERSVQEYRRHVHTYFQAAQQISLHEPVPTPLFSVKGAQAC
ncbi:TPA: hypothetical protein N0F65_004727 [Lagenidium giganteum]|uniref:Uncharacterized protein n=1 Tax=Lagenidium giganteum TaxID=4803 RepID=A0AAV2Z5V1_9STRA|nr:TPA: hypothetical protein N0F65_004727 [Lagenidium giganteum]